MAQPMSCWPARAVSETVTQVTVALRAQPEQLAAVDLRHQDGYAIRLRGVSTLAAADQEITVIQGNR